MAEEENRSPRIVSISWDRTEVEGLAPGKDFKLYPGGGREWDWSETGTRHSPGVQPQDVQELLDRGATAVVLSLGMQLQLQLQLDPRTLRFLDERGVSVQSAETTPGGQAVQRVGDDATGRRFVPLDLLTVWPWTDAQHCRPWVVVSIQGTRMRHARMQPSPWRKALGIRWAAGGKPGLTRPGRCGRNGPAAGRTRGRAPRWAASGRHRG